MAVTQDDICRGLALVLLEEKQKRGSGDVIIRIGLNDGNIARAEITPPVRQIRSEKPVSSAVQ